MLKQIGLGALASLTLAFSGVTAQADTNGVFKYTSPNPTHGGGIVRQMDMFEMTYQEAGGQSTFGLTYSFNDNIEIAKVPNGFWLVVSDGENPKSNMDEYAILYGDIEEGRISAYVYNGKNNGESFKKQGEFIQSFGDATNPALVFDEITKTVSLTIDVTDINALYTTAAWDGVAFDEKVGIWFHPAEFQNVTYDAEGKIIPMFTENGQVVKASIHNRGWYDKANRPTTHEVSEPATLALLGLGLTGFAIARRRKVAA